MELREDTLPDEFVRHLALDLLDELEHRVVRRALEHDLARVQLEDGHGRRPHVDRAAVLQPHHHLGRSVKARDQVRSDLVVVARRGRAKVADLEQVVLVVDDHVIRLEVGVHDIEPLEIAQRNKHLASIGLDGLHRDPALVPMLLDGRAQVLVHRLEDHAQVVLVVELVEEDDAVPLALGVVLLNLHKERDLLLTRTAHHLVVALHLDGHLGARHRVLHVEAAHHRRKDALAVRTEHLRTSTDGTRETSAGCVSRWARQGRRTRRRRRRILARRTL